MLPPMSARTESFGGADVVDIQIISLLLIQNFHNCRMHSEFKKLRSQTSSTLAHKRSVGKQKNVTVRTPKWSECRLQNYRK